MGSGSVSDETTDEAIGAANQIAEEGMVLLENDGLLPVSNPSNINLFGWPSVNPAYGGTGSGGPNMVQDPEAAPSVKYMRQACKNVIFLVSQTETG